MIGRDVNDAVGLRREHVSDRQVVSIRGRHYAFVVSPAIVPRLMRNTPVDLGEIAVDNRSVDN
jgi:hypothetical protein